MVKRISKRQEQENAPEQTVKSGKVTLLEVQKRNQARVNVYLDDTFAFSLTLDEAMRLRKGQELSETEVSALRGIDEVQRALDAGVNYLSYRSRSTHEIRQKLLGKYTPSVVDMAMERISALGYLDDRAFAAMWIGERNKFKPISPRALRYELRRKGIPDDLIDEALIEVDAEDAAYRAAQPLLRRLKGTTLQEFREKIAAHLARRGFAYSVTRSVTARLIEEINESQEDDAAFFSEAREERPQRRWGTRSQPDMD